MTAWNITDKFRGLHEPHRARRGPGALAPAADGDAAAPRVADHRPRSRHRYQKKVENFYHDPAKTAEHGRRLGRTRCAWRNLCIAGGMAVNGVSAPALRHPAPRRIPRWHYQMEPEKFKNVTNGIDHRRWLAQINPRLDGLICRPLRRATAICSIPRQLKKLEAYRRRWRGAGAAGRRSSAQNKLRLCRATSRRRRA